MAFTPEFRLYKDRIKKNVYFDRPFSYKYLNIKPLETEFDAVLSLCCNPGESKAEIMPDETVYSCVLFYGDNNQIMSNVSTGVHFNKSYGYKKISCDNSLCSYNKYCMSCPAYANRIGIKFDDRCEYAQRI